MSSLPPPASYFPVKPGPLAMAAGLHRLGTDFGNGPADALHLQLDDQRARYLEAKARVPASRHGSRVSSAGDERALEAVGRWLAEVALREHGPVLDAGAVRRADLHQLGAMLQEDLAVVRRDAEGRDAAILVDVSFPSGWRPERVLGTSFASIHAPVPGFARTHGAARSMVASMIDRGPYVRFVWTVSADDHLDHHPEEGRRDPWRAGGPGFLRVERQVTVPFPGESAALFLIRTYLTPCSRLDEEQRRTLRSALEQMPEAVRRYKGLQADWPLIAELLAPSGSLSGCGSMRSSPRRPGP